MSQAAIKLLRDAIDEQTAMAQSNEETAKHHDESAAQCRADAQKYRDSVAGLQSAVTALQTVLTALQGDEPAPTSPAPASLPADTPPAAPSA